MTAKRREILPRAGWLLAALLFLAFLAGLARRDRIERAGGEVIRMLFVPSVEQGTLARRGNELAEFVRRDSGLVIRSAVPTSYAAVVQALGTGQADIAWVPAFAYVVAHARYGAEARLQVVREAERFAVVVTRSGAGEPAGLADLAKKRIAIPKSFSPELRATLTPELNRWAPGWVEVPATDDKDAVQQLLDRADAVDAAASSWVFSGPKDLVGDGRKLLEYDRPGTLEKTRIAFKTAEAARERVNVYYGSVLTRTDSGVSRLEDLNGRPFAFSDATSTSGYIFPLNLLNASSVKLGHVYFAGGHANVVQAVADGKVAGGSSFYSPPGKVNEVEHTYVADARHLVMKRMTTDEARLAFLDDVRVLALTDPIPNDVCCVRRGFPKSTWERFERSLQKFIATPEGLRAYLDLVAAVAARPCDDTTFDGFRSALRATGVSAVQLLQAEEEKLKKKREEKKK
ncbi:MAG: PhnD/SsuA/transferrin family substrate-binding protein [Holophagales bacterium]|nr:PhnD/SsuA/transferrin family substrate-binding protein [Holophagales bacterium]